MIIPNDTGRRPGGALAFALFLAMGTSGGLAQSTGASIFVSPSTPFFHSCIGNAPPKDAGMAIASNAMAGLMCSACHY